MTIYTHNAHTLASEAAIKDLMMQAKKIKHDVIGLSETRGRHLLNAEKATKKDLKERRAEALAETAEAEKSIRYARRDVSVRNRTTPGTNRIRPEHLKNLSPVLINTLARLFTRYLSKCKLPKQWKTSKTVLLYEKGDPHDIGNYRPICLLSAIYKLFTRVIFNRIEKVLDEGQPCEQAGFRKAFNTIDHIHTVSKLIEVPREYKMPLCLTFIDLKKAFDSVETEAIMEELDNQGVPTQYKANPENAMRKLEWDDMGVKIDVRRQKHHLLFADDIVLITPGISQAERMVTEFYETCGCIGLQLNLQNTMLMRMPHSRSTERTDPNAPATFIWVGN
ncbi:hypothetical protein RB195_005486 [Necator americanus]|uniref:Reverse transcriptase domain-containing protein n=1 Tax=Necator americanus TaxID=51031 RepID=A0ABR1BN36_NECAM